MPSRDTLRDRRRAEIVSVARGLVAEGGLSALTISAIEDRVDFTRGVITYHFKNKDDIVMAVLDSALDEIDRATRAATEARGSFEQKIGAVLEGQVRGFIDHAEAGAILIAFWGRASADPRAAQVNAALYTRYRGESKWLLDAGVEAGIVRDDLDTETFAALLVGQVLGIVLQHVFDPGAIDVDRAVAAAARSVWAEISPR